MRKQERLVVAGVIVLALLQAVQAFPAQKPKGPAKLTTQDYLEIHELLARFNGTMNVGDAEGFASLFLPDAILNLGVDRKMEGRAALVKFIQDYKLPLVQIRVFMNPVVTATPEGAIVTCDQFAWFMDRNPPGFITIGAYNDIVVRTRDGWRFKSRTLHRGPATPGALGKCQKCE